METVNVQQLIDAGVHFGCRVSRWNPKMAPFIHGRRNLIHIIDLRETLRGILRAQNVLYHMAAEGSTILWVGTKRQVKGVVQDAGQRTGMPICTERWIGGTLTNFSVIRSRLKRLEELEKIEEQGNESQFSKKMLSSLRRERRKIVRTRALCRARGRGQSRGHEVPAWGRPGGWRACAHRSRRSRRGRGGALRSMARSPVRESANSPARKSASRKSTSPQVCKSQPVRQFASPPSRAC